MAILTPNVIAKEALMIMTNELVVGNLVHKGDASNFTSAKIGDTVTIRKPASFRVDNFTSTISTQRVNEGSTSLTLEKHLDTSIELTSKEMTLDLNSFSEQVVKPVMAEFAQEIDSYILSKYNEVAQVVGTAGSPVDSLAELAEVEAALMDFKIPNSGRAALVNPTGKAKILSIQEVARADARGDGGTALRNASMGHIMGLDWYAAQNIKKHTSGVPGGTPVAGALAAPTSVGNTSTVTVTAGGAAGTYKKGDVVKFAGVDGTYVVTADVTLNGSGAGAIVVAPQVPTAIPASAAITLTASHTANLVGNFRGISFANVPLEMPYESGKGAVITHNGISIRVIYDWNATSKSQIISFDTLIGAKVTDPRLLARLLG